VRQTSTARNAVKAKSRKHQQMFAENERRHDDITVPFTMRL